MTRAEIFENRRDVGKKLCEQIRQNDGKMINAKNFSERPYYDGEKKYKKLFSQRESYKMKT